MKPDVELDLRGDVCPYTYVKTKLQVEEMEPNQILKVIVDYEPASRNIPRSIKTLGHEVLKIEKENEKLWSIWIKVKEST